MIEKAKAMGYDEANAESKVCQDTIGDSLMQKWIAIIVSLILLTGCGKRQDPDDFPTAFHH